MHLPFALSAVMLQAILHIVNTEPHIEKTPIIFSCSTSKLSLINYLSLRSF